MEYADRQRKLDLYRLIVARHDIESAAIAFEQIVEHVQDVTEKLFQPLLFGALVSYAKPFVGNKSLGPLPKRWERFDVPEHRERHNRIIEARHQIAAHNDPEVVQVLMLSPGVSFAVNGEELELDQLSYALKGVYPVALVELEGYVETCRYQEQRMFDHIAELKDEVFPAGSLAHGEIFRLQVD